MPNHREEDTFYGIYTFDGNLSVDLTSVEPFYKALNKVAGIYVVSRSAIESYYGKRVCGCILGWSLRQERRRKYVMYVADDLGHYDRLITIGHELIHIILEIQGFPFDSHEVAEQWIDTIAKRFYQRNPGFLDYVYKYEARIA